MGWLDDIGSWFGSGSDAASAASNIGPISNGADYASSLGGFGPVASGDDYANLLGGASNSSNSMDSIFSSSNAPAAADAAKTGSSFWGKLGDAALSPQGISGLITGGLGVINSIGASDKADKELKRQNELDKMNAMLQLAKLKYGATGGGGGDPLARQKLMIQALESSKEGQQNASQALMSGFNGIYK